MRSLLILIVLSSAPSLARGQVADDFSDGDFLADPAWTGTSAYWQIVPMEGQLMLNSNGPAFADTLFLATPSASAYGTWRFRFSYQDVNLSNFNGARVFLIADTSDLRHDVRGYFLQFGTNNTNEIRLYRIDGDPTTRRRELGRSAEPLLESSSGTVDVEIVRDPDDRWVVMADGVPVFTAQDGTYRHASHFGFWVKHTAAAAQSYFFGDVVVEPGEEPPPDPLWIESVDITGPTSLDVRFNRPVLAETACDPAIYHFASHVRVAAVQCNDSEEVQLIRLRLHDALTPGEDALAVREIRDTSGAMHAELFISFEVTPYDVRPFEPVQTRYDIRSPGRILVSMSRPVDGDRLQLARAILPAPTHVMRVAPGEHEEDVLILLDRPLVAGRYELRIEELAATNGDVFSGSIDLDIGHPPGRGDLVINEIHFVPSDPRLEFIEIYNRSVRRIDLAQLDFADNRLLRSAVTTTHAVLEPGEYAVLVQDSIAFRTAFPDVPLIRPPTWHTLNNSGDAVHLYAGEQIIDSVSFAASWGDGAASLERIDPDAPSIRQNFGPSVATEGATPGRRNSIFSQDRPPVTALAAEEIAPGEVAVFFDGAIQAPADGRTFVLIDEIPAESSFHRHDDQLVFRHAAARPRTIHISGVLDVFGVAVADTVLAIANRPLPGELVISEVMYDPLADPDDGLPDQPEYLEITNVSDRPLSLTSLALADPIDENGAARQFGHEGQLLALLPGQYAVFSAEPNSDETRLQRAFPAIDDASVILPVRRSTLSLTLGGRMVRLLDAFQEEVVLLDSVHYRPEWHHAAVRQPRGRSLERLDLLARANDAANWSTSVSETGGTPGRVNSVSVDSPPDDRSAGLMIDPAVFSPDDDGMDDLTRIHFRLRAPSGVVRARIFDSRGRLVRNLDASSFTGQTGTLVWDGFDDDRRSLPIGIYIVLLDATDVENGTTEAYRDVVVLARPLR